MGEAMVTTTLGSSEATHLYSSALEGHVGGARGHPQRVFRIPGGAELLVEQQVAPVRLYMFEEGLAHVAVDKYSTATPDALVSDTLR